MWSVWMGGGSTGGSLSNNDHGVGNSPKREIDDRIIKSALKKHRSEIEAQSYSKFNEKSRGWMLATIHNLLFKVYTVFICAKDGNYNKSERIE